MANATIETLRTEGSDLFEYLNSTSSKLEESRVRVSALEEMVKELQADLEGEDVEQRKLLHASDSGGTHSELVQLRAALEAAEARYQEEQIRNTMELQSAYEMAECVKVKAGMRETELGSTLGMAMSEISDLKVRLLDKETAVQSLSEMNKELNHKIEDEKANQFDSELKLMKATTDLTDLKARLLDKEREMQGILEENALLKLELSKREIDHQNNLAAAVSDAEMARAAEKDALSRVDFVSGEVEKNNSRATRVMEQLVAAQAVNSEMDSELRRLRVQSDQWRKAAEAAAAVLSPGLTAGLSKGQVLWIRTTVQSLVS
ncbi:hypothetical protein HPP92_000880 [Vanilla planifolia]|uniref:Uncharacterized protein n=1 Tax=Vanilla planifolia TaxID=51239 RepID=A0A835SBL0_VANPL|nr:hypothetical protein HPP92_000880 [Vanilla planifolia]